MSREIDEFKEPFGTIALDDGTVVLVDSPQHCIRILNSDGSSRCRIGSKGSKFEQFFQPRGLCKLTRSTVCVCDSGNRRITFIDIDEEKVTQSFGGLQRPWDVEYLHEQELLVVVDLGFKGLHFFDCSGNLVNSEQHEFMMNPIRVHQNPITKHLHVMDKQGSSVHEFTVMVSHCCSLEVNR